MVREIAGRVESGKSGLVDILEEISDRFCFLDGIDGLYANLFSLMGIELIVRVFEIEALKVGLLEAA